MSTILLITPSATPEPFLPLAALAHQILTRTVKDQVLAQSATCDLVIIDARSDVAAAQNIAQMFATAGVAVPRLAIVALHDLASYSRSWRCDDFVVDGVTPVELDARLRLMTSVADESAPRVAAAGIVIDDVGYSVWLDERPLDLTYTEFELLRYLATHPGRVFSREQLLWEVWGNDYYGGVRTVDVHVRRLRAKLGPEHAALIGTVRNVGYRFTAR
jgi:DNA-binding response OmpR family regulator